MASKPKAPAPLTIAYRAPADLKADPRNARTHSPEQIAQLRASIREFGFTNPVLLRPDGMIGAGHGRVEAAKAEGLAEIPTVTITGLTADQWRAYVLADNRLALNAGWDEDLLRAELAALAELEVDLSSLGFDQGELAAIFLEREDGENDPDAEWQGMPEFDQKDKTAFRSLAVHFKDQGAVDKFAALIGQTLTEKTRFLWFPEIEIETYADKRWTTKAVEAEPENAE